MYQKCDASTTLNLVVGFYPQSDYLPLWDDLSMAHSFIKEKKKIILLVQLAAC